MAERSINIFLQLESEMAMKLDTRMLRLIPLAAIVLTPLGCTHFNSRWFSRSEPEARTEVQLVADKGNWFKKKPVAKADSITKRESNVAVRKVSLDGQGQVLGEANETTLTTAAFAARVVALNEQSPAFSECVIRRFPDIAQQFLLEYLTAEKPNYELLEQVASIHDAQTGSRQGAWQVAVKQLKSQPTQYREFATTRRQIHAALKEGQPLPQKRSLADLLPKNANSVWRYDAWSLTATLQLLDEKPRDAAQSYYRSLEASADVIPYAAQQAELLMSESVRRDGNQELAIQSWSGAVSRAAELMLGATPLIDATFWDNACYLKPQTSWPDKVADAVLIEHQRRGWMGLIHQDSEVQLASSIADSSAETTDCLIWSLIGYARLYREEPQAALVAFKKAESLARNSAHADLWQVAQARALLQLGQTAPATALLMKHAQNKDPRVSLQSLALLGTMKLQANQPALGLSLLRRSFETFPDATWPGQAEARADLGLAYLMMGDESNGLQELHTAQRHFEAIGDTSLLLTSLQNELAYHEKKSHRKEAKAIRERIVDNYSN